MYTYIPDIHNEAYLLLLETGPTSAIEFGGGGGGGGVDIDGRSNRSFATWLPS